MRTTHRPRHAPILMDVLRPSHAYGRPSATPTHDARRWLRLLLVALAGTATLAVLLGTV